MITKDIKSRMTITPVSPTEQDYKEALHAAMLYARSLADDGASGIGEPSERSDMLLKELTTTHAKAIKTVARELHK